MTIVDIDNKQIRLDSSFQSFYKSFFEQANWIRSNKIIFITIGQNFKFYDQYSLGKLISFLLDLKKSEIKLKLTLEKTSRQVEEKYNILGIINQIFNNGSSFICHNPYEGRESVSSIFLQLVKFKKFEFDRDFRKITSKTVFIKEQTEIIFLELLKSIRDNIKSEEVLQALFPSLNYLLFDITREILSNFYNHSNESSFYFSANLFKETKILGQPRRKGSKNIEGEYCIDFIYVDKGQGILSSFLNHFNLYDRSLEEYKDLFTSSSIISSYELQTKERSILENLLNGKLVLRSGRVSEGYYDISQKLRWYNGILNLKTGRSEVATRSNYGKINSSIDISKESMYSQGIILSSILPIYALKKFHIDFVRNDFVTQDKLPFDNDKRNFAEKAIRILRLNEVDKAFYNLSSKESDVDHSNVLIHTLENIYKVQAANKADNVFFLYDFKCSANLNSNFIDLLIQQFLKHESFDLIKKIIFYNVPRTIIFDLFNKNCQTFLIVKNSFVCLYDELDNLFVLGIPLVSTKKFGPSEVIQHLSRHGAKQLSTKSIKESIPMELDLVKFIHKKFDENSDNIIYRDANILRLHNILVEVKKRQFFEYTSILQQYLKLPTKREKYKLYNGSYTNKLIDFTSYYESIYSLVSLSKLLIDSVNNLPIWDSIITYNTNGYVLSHACRKILNINQVISFHFEDNNIIIEDKIKGVFRPVLILDILYHDDFKRGSFLYNLLELLSKHKIKNIIVLALISLTGKKKLKVGDLEISVSSLFGKNRYPKEYLIDENESRSMYESMIKRLPKRIRSQTIPAIKYNEELSIEYVVVEKPSQPKFSKKEKKNEKISAKKAINSQLNQNHSKYNVKYALNELSLDFWHNMSELEILSSISKNKERRNLVYYDNISYFLQSKRMRRKLSKYVAQILSFLTTEIEVIIHPNHALASSLAFLLTQQLNLKVLVFRIPQPKYGSKLIIEKTVIGKFKEALSKRKNKRKLKALIIDDKIISGSSIVTMVGLAEILNIAPVSCFVISNRAKPQNSETFSKIFNNNFFYYYRLHMPLFKGSKTTHSEHKLNSNKSNIKNPNFLRDIVQAYTSTIPVNKSFFNFIEKYISSSSNDDKKGQLDYDLIIKEVPYLDQGELVANHVVSILLKSKNEYISIYTKTAIVFNYISTLIEQNIFWRFLASIRENDTINNRYFLMIIIAQITYVFDNKYFKEKTQYEKFLIDTYNFYKLSHFKKENTSLYLVLWYSLARISPEFFNSDILVGLAIDIEDCQNRYDDDFINNIIKALQVCNSICGSISINFGQIIRKTLEKNQFKFSNLIFQLASKRFEFGNKGKKMEASQHYKKICDPIQNMLIKSNQVRRYLTQAPGYFHVLLIMKKLFSASFVCLLNYNKSKQEYGLWSILGSSTFSSNSIPVDTLEENSFFQTNNDKVLNFINNLNEETSNIESYLNLPLVEDNYLSKYRYRILIGYDCSISDTIIEHEHTSIFDTWHRVKSKIELILLEIESEYFLELKNWKLSSSLSIVSHLPNISDNKRRLIHYIKYALSNNLAIGNFNLSSQSFNIPKFRKLIIDRITSFQDAVGQYKIMSNNSDLALLEEINKKLIKLKSSTTYNIDELNQEYFNFRVDVLSIVLIEMLTNSLLYSKSHIELDISSHKSENYNIVLTIRNDKDHKYINNSKGSQLGRTSSLNAAKSANGYFKTEEQNDVYEAVLSIPLFKVPKELTSIY